MPYSKFTLSRAVEDFDLTVREDPNLFAAIPPVVPTSLLREILIENVPWAVAVGSEKARSEGIVTPILLEVKRQLKGQISVFSGEEFNVDRDRGLNGFCDFLFSRSATSYIIQAPVLMLVEAKKGELDVGWGQCVAEMVAAQRFNLENDSVVPNIYGSVTTGTRWQFLRLTDQRLTIDLVEYLDGLK